MVGEAPDVRLAEPVGVLHPGDVGQGGGKGAFNSGVDVLGNGRDSFDLAQFGGDSFLLFGREVVGDRAIDDTAGQATALSLKVPSHGGRRSRSRVGRGRLTVEFDTEAGATSSAIASNTGVGQHTPLATAPLTVLIRATPLCCGNASGEAMDRYVAMLVVGFIALLIGLGILKEVNIKDLGARIANPGPLAGLLLSTLGILLLAVGTLGSVGWIGSNESTDKAGPSHSASPSSASPSVSPSQTSSSASSSASTSTSRSSASASMTSAALVVTLSKPAEGAVVPLTGTTIAGVVRGDLGDNTLWLFTFSDGAWYLDRVISPKLDESFQVPSGQVGIQEEAGKTFRFEVVMATPAQAAIINHQAPDQNGDVVFPARPGKQVASRVVTRG